MTSPESDSGPNEARRLVIFGCGYVGGELARVARSSGWRVTALTRNEARAAELEELGVRVVVAALESDAWHEKVSREQDFVVNCVSSGGGGLEGYRRSYVDGTKSILRWAGAGISATYVYTSSTSVYGQGEGETVTEDSTVGGGSEASAPLLEAEGLVQASGCFLRSFILRLAGIYGPGRHYLLNQLRHGATLFPGTGGHRLNLVHRDDIVSAILACCAAPPAISGQVFNVADDAPVPKGEVAAWLAHRVGVSAPHFERDLVEPVRDGGVSPVRGRSGPVPDRVISNTRIKQVLGWAPRFPNFQAGYDQIFALELPGG